MPQIGGSDSVTVVDALTFLGLEPSSDPLRWRLPVTSGVSTPGQFLFGGAGLAGAVAAMEHAAGRPVVWAAAQYLSYAPTGSVLDLEVTLAVVGHHTTQARAVGRADGQEILTVNAALGRRNLDLTATFVARPDVPGPESSRPRALTDEFSGTVLERVEVRLARGRQHHELDGTGGDGRCALWARLPGQLPGQPDLSSAWLALLGDYVPSGVAQALGRPAWGNSLDNTIRVLRLVPTEWVLCDIHILGIANGFGHGRAHLWSQEGTLLGTASQSVIVRFPRPSTPPDR
jgi:acyl-CoA thioesterase-2